MVMKLSLLSQLSNNVERLFTSSSPDGWIKNIWCNGIHLFKKALGLGSANGTGSLRNFIKCHSTVSRTKRASIKPRHTFVHLVCWQVSKCCQKLVSQNWMLNCTFTSRMPKRYYWAFPTPKSNSFMQIIVKGLVFHLRLLCWPHVVVCDKQCSSDVQIRKFWYSTAWEKFTFL
jgi:hypothetical protein